MTSSQKTIIEIGGLKHVACLSTLCGPLTDLTPVTECGLAQCHKTFYCKVFFVVDVKGQKGLMSLDINIQQMSTDTTWQ